MRVTTKGQVTIPLKIRKLLKIKPASEVDFIVEGENRVYIKVKKTEPATDRFVSLRGSASIKMTTDEIMALTRE